MSGVGNRVRRKVEIQGPSPWGFRIKGGAEFGSVVTIEIVNKESKAEAAGVRVGEILVEVNGVNVEGKTHLEVKDLLTKDKTYLKLLLETNDAKRNSSYSCSNTPIKCNDAASSSTTSYSQTSTSVPTAKPCLSSSQSYDQRITPKRESRDPDVEPSVNQESSYQECKQYNAFGCQRKYERGLETKFLRNALKRLEMEEKGIYQTDKSKESDHTTQKLKVDESYESGNQSGTSNKAEFVKESSSNLIGKDEDSKHDLNASQSETKSFVERPKSPIDTVSGERTYQSSNDPTYSLVPENTDIVYSDHGLMNENLYCHGCKERIQESSYTTIAGKPFHHEHVICKYCNEDMRKKKIVEEDSGTLVCYDCAIKKNSPTCNFCNKLITDTVIKLENKTIHEGCFLCSKCKRRISGGYFMNGPSIMCEGCSKAKVRKVCTTCKKAITGIDAFMEVKEAPYHVGCLKCMVCSTVIEPGASYVISRIQKRICCSQNCAKGY